MSHQAGPCVMIIDHRDHDLQLLERAVRQRGFTQVVALPSTAAALDGLDRFSPDVLVVDLDLLLGEGCDLLRRIRGSQRWHLLPVLLAGSRRPATAIRAAVLLGVSGFISKPFNGTEIGYKLDLALRGTDSRAAESLDLQATAP